MDIHGLQKLTLLDFPGHIACTVFLGGCDFRCPFCHNAEIIDGSSEVIMKDDELLEFLKKKQGLLDGVAITGGEPLLRKDLPEFLEKVRALGYQIKLDTNGTHPERLRELMEKELVDYVAMDIKNSPARYAQTAGLKSMDLSSVRESVSLLLTGKADYEFRTTVLAELHDEESFREIGKWIRGAKRYFLQPFVDRDSVPFGGLHAPSREALIGFLEIVKPYVEQAEIRGMD